MRKIFYAGGGFYTGDAVAAALMEYAEALANNNRTAIVDVPSRSLSGQRGTQALLLGPGSPMMSEPTEFDGLDEIIDDDAVIRIKSLMDDVLTPAGG